MVKESVSNIYVARFSLITLILLILITNLSCKRSRDLEIDAVKSIVIIRSLQEKHASKYEGEFADSFNKLIKTMQLDKKFNGEKPIVEGYRFTMKVRKSSWIKPAFYSINVDSIKSEKLFESAGTRNFYFDPKVKLIKFTDKNRQANANDPSI